MSTRADTAGRILDAARALFNLRGYAATSLTEIAASIGISQGNLTYHFPSKSDLAVRIQAEAQAVARARRQQKQPGAVADDYVGHLLFAMSLTWRYRFLLRDRIHFDDKLDDSGAEFEADYEELLELLKRVEGEGMFRTDVVGDINTIARSIWIMSRYWIDYLRDFEGLQEISWADQERGISHHFAILMPCLTAPAKRQFQGALERARNNVRGANLA